MGGVPVGVNIVLSRVGMGNGKDLRSGLQPEEEHIARIYILGCHHALQSVEICWRWTWARELSEAIGKNVDELARQQKGHFAARVCEIAQGHAIDFIGEEFDEGVPTTASLAIPNWHMIDMPRAERHRRQIPDDYTDCERYTDEQRTGWNCERERYMFEDVGRHLGRAESVLVICGSEHINGLTNLFVEAGHELSGSENVTTAAWFERPAL